ncbi:hypothetical protein [Streptomyces mirabilis]|uniref:hypothetical protein n=1 Tax=Streptomyces mirabilis TaxID=68239 RepID=UPI0036AC9DF2
MDIWLLVRLGQIHSSVDVLQPRGRLPDKQRKFVEPMVALLAEDDNRQSLMNCTPTRVGGDARGPVRVEDAAGGQADRADHR